MIRGVVFIVLIRTIFGVPAIAHAADERARDHETERLLGAKSEAEVSRVVTMAQELREARAACQAELRSPSSVPAHCFRVLAIESAGSLKENPALLQLEATCRTRLRDLRRIEAMDAALASGWLSKGCERSVRARIDEITYMISESNPETAFRRRPGAHIRPAF